MACRVCFNFILFIFFSTNEPIQALEYLWSLGFNDIDKMITLTPRECALLDAVSDVTSLDEWDASVSVVFCSSLLLSKILRRSGHRVRLKNESRRKLQSIRNEYIFFAQSVQRLLKTQYVFYKCDYILLYFVFLQMYEMLWLRCGVRRRPNKSISEVGS